MKHTRIRLVILICMAPLAAVAWWTDNVGLLMLIGTVTAIMVVERLFP